MLQNLRFGGAQVGRKMFAVLAVAAALCIPVATAAAHDGEGPPPTKMAFCDNGQNVSAYGDSYIVDHIKYSQAADNGGYWTYQFHILWFTLTGYSLDKPGSYAFNVSWTPVTSGMCPVAPPPPPPSGMFLCYSHFEPDGGYAFSDTKTALAALKDPSTVGWTQSWAPYAVEGPAPSAGYPVVGSYYLTCQLPSGKTPTGQYHGGDGPGATDSISSMDALTAGAAEYPIAA